MAVAIVHVSPRYGVVFPGMLFRRIDLEDVLGSLMGIERSLLREHVEPSCGPYFKIRLSGTAVRLLMEETRPKTTGLSFDDYPLREVHPDWVEPGERFACRLNRILVVERTAPN